MDINTINAAKSALNHCCETFDSIMEMTGLIKPDELNENMPLSDVLKWEIYNFLAYLSVSDDVISWKEVRFIGELFGVSLTPKRLNDYIIDKNIYSTEFENKVPATLGVLVVLDNSAYDLGAELDTELSELFVQLCVLLGKTLISSNGREKMEETERQNFENYIRMMQEYIAENSESHHTDIIYGYKKNGSDDTSNIISFDSKKKKTGSVKAPKKKM